MAASDEVAALDRVLTRLALTEEDSLEKILGKLLPVVIGQLKTPHQATRSKVLEILSHVNKRVRGHAAIKMPLDALLALYADPGSAPLVRNFALVYLEMAFERAPGEARLAVVPRLLEGVAARTPQHREMLLRLALAGLQAYAVMPSSHHLGSEADFAARHAFLAAATDRAAFLGFALKVLLYQPPSSLLRAPAAAAPDGPPRTPRAHNGPAVRRGLPALGAAAVEQAAPEGAPPTPPGLAPADLTRVEGKTPPSGAELEARKLGVLNFTAAAGLAPADALPLYLAGAADPREAVSRRAEELLRKRCSTDGNRPAVDLEDAALVERLFALFHGTLKGAPGVLPAERATPAGPALQARLMGMFTRSVAAANAFPAVLQAVLAGVYGAGASLRLKAGGMELAVWVMKHASDERLLPASPEILAALLHLLGDETARGSDAAAAGLRGFTYQAVGQLAARMPALLAANPPVAAHFFAALSTEPPGVRAALQEALGSLAGAYAGCKGAAATSMEALVLESIGSGEEAVRLAAAQWAARLFPFGHVPARYVCVLAAGDDKLGVREAGAAGLLPLKPGDKPNAVQSSAYPAAEDMVAFLRTRLPRLASPADPAKPLALPPRAFVTLVAFLRRCLGEARSGRKAECAEGGGDVDMLADVPAKLPTEYLGLLEHALVRDGTSELAVAALEALLEEAGAAPAAFAAHYRPRVAWLQGFLAHADPAARELAAQLLGIAAADMDATGAQALLCEMCSVFAAAPAGKAGAAAADDAQPKLLRPKARFEEVDGALAAVGYVLAQCVTGQPAVPRDSLAAAAGALWKGLEPATRLGAVAGMARLMANKEPKVAARAATAAGLLCLGDGDAAVLAAAADALFGTVSSRAEPVYFAAGEALCCVFGGVDIRPEAILHRRFHSLSAELESSSEDPAAHRHPDPTSDPASAAAPAPSHGAFTPMAIDGADPAHGSEASPGEGQGAAAAGFKRDEQQRRILDHILDTVIYNSRAEVRAAGCVWLVALASYTGRQRALLGRLGEVQEAFSALLGDASETAQEMASRGLSMVYRLGDKSAQEQLLASLMGTLQGGPRKRRAVKLTGESRVFEDGALGEAPGGGSLATYRELCALATDMGQPDLLYRFMDLANHAAAATSSRGAAFGFASISRLAGKQLEPYVAQLIPKLYRYQYDPNARVRDAMTHIWRALVPEPRKALEAHFDAVAAELLREMGGRLWRSREAACAALADLLQGRRWAEVRPHLANMWGMVLRCADDIKESVRVSAAGALRALRGLTLRLCDPAATPPADANDAVALALPLLLEKGVTSQVAEVQGLALTTLAKIVAAAGAERIRPHLPELVPALLEALSGLEDSRLNYVEQHSERLGLDAGRLESLRVSASRASPMGDTLDACGRFTDAAALGALAPRLAQLIKRGVGVNTRVGAARFVAALAARLGSDARPHTGVLIKALVGAAVGERSGAVRRSYAVAVAALARQAPEARVAKLVAAAVTLYTEPGDRDARQVGGLLLRELARGAPEAFAGQAAAALPTAFLAARDEDADVAAAWADVWEEGTASGAGAARLYAGDIVPLILRDLGAQQWGRKKAAALAVTALAKSGAEALPPHAPVLASALLAELPGRLAAALAALEAALVGLRGDHLAAVAPPLLEAVSRSTLGAAGSAPDVQAGDGKEGDGEGVSPAPLPETMRCLAAAWQRASSATASAHGAALADALALALHPAHAWAARLVPGVLVAMEETRVSQVRAASLEALAALLTASSGALPGATVPPYCWSSCSGVWPRCNEASSEACHTERSAEVPFWKVGYTAREGVQATCVWPSGQRFNHDSDEETEESWNDKDTKVLVTQPKGFMCHVSLRGKVDLPPDKVFDILVDGDNHKVFKAIKAVAFRKVLRDDGAGRLEAEVEQVGQWKFMLFSGSFSTRLYVSQDKRRGTIDFKLARPGLMKNFEGKWRVQPFTQATPNEVSGRQPAPARPSWLPAAFDNLHLPGKRESASASLVTLEQSILPGFIPPKPLDRLIKGIAAKQIRRIMEDLRGEVANIKAGRPTLQLMAPAADGADEEERHERGLAKRLQLRPL
ncbi:hypothetical protein WJX81_007994 [Elliptochloris bilobata]|uniref:Uncharacterized protein n=1 Tax=Elliptochloris bilobata TaxID=381761 RepID=A0AAW1RMZ1_9CHLO